MSFSPIAKLKAVRSVPKAARSQERAALHAAIVKRDAAAAEVERVSAALHRAKESRFAAFQALEDARENLAKSRSEAAINAAARYLGEAPLSDLRIPDGRREVERLESEFEDEKVLIAALEQRLHEAKSRLGYAEMSVERCLTEALQVSPEVEAAVAAFRDAVREFATREATMRYLFKSGAIPSSLRFAAQLCENDRQGNSPDAAWVEAIAQLSRDADAQLP
jgi:hypothetical protein